MLAFIGDPAPQKLIAALLRDGGLGEQQNLFVLDTIDASSLKQFPRRLGRRALGDLLGARNQNVQLRAVDSDPLSRHFGTRAAAHEDRRTTNRRRICRVSALAALAAHATAEREQYRFLMSKLDPKTDAILRQSAAQALARSTPGRARPAAACATSTCRRPTLSRFPPRSHVFARRTMRKWAARWSTLLRKSPAALGTLGEDRLKALFADYPGRSREIAKPPAGTLRAAQAGRVERLHSLEPLLTAGGDTGRGRRHLLRRQSGLFQLPHHRAGRGARWAGPHRHRRHPVRI